MAASERHASSHVCACCTFRCGRECAGRPGSRAHLGHTFLHVTLRIVIDAVGSGAPISCVLCWTSGQFCGGVCWLKFPTACSDGCMLSVHVLCSAALQVAWSAGYSACCEECSPSEAAQCGERQGWVRSWLVTWLVLLGESRSLLTVIIIRNRVRELKDNAYTLCVPLDAQMILPSGPNLVLKFCIATSRLGITIVSRRHNPGTRITRPNVLCYQYKYASKSASHTDTPVSDPTWD